MDKNPSFGKDEGFANMARKAADVLWQGTKGNTQAIPSAYLRNLDHEYSDGSVSLLSQLNKVSLSEGSYEEFSEVVNVLVRTDMDDWPELDSIQEIQAEKLFSEDEFDFDWDFAEPQDMSSKVELFLKKVIASVYRDGVTEVSDKLGNPPNPSNNYLMGKDGSFSGVFYDAPEGEDVKEFPFRIKEVSPGKWEILY